MTDLRAELLSTLKGEVGYRQPASGVTKYGSWFADLVGDSSYRDGNWCAMGQLWCADQVGLLDLVGGAKKEWAWVPSWLTYFRNLGWVVKHPDELVLVMFDWEPNGVPNHVGMAIGKANSSGYFPTIEFNTTVDGHNVCARRTRHTSQALAFVKVPIPASLADDSCWMG